MRALCAVLALLVTVTIAVRLNLTAVEHDTTFVGAAWRSFRFFTIWTNALIGAVCLWIALGGRPAQWVTAGLAMAIALVAGVYHALLAADQSYEGAEVYVDLSVHTIVPIFYILLWVMLLPKHELVWRHLFYWMAYPVIYCVYALVRAAADGTYPYFFLDVSRLGVTGVAVWIAGLAAVFAVFGALVIGAVRLRHGKALIA